MVQDIRTIGLPALMSFHTVGRLGGISAAAKHLGMAKSGVSRHIAQLEAHFGVRLLERNARAVRLTPVGVRLGQRVQSILAEVNLLTDIVQEESVAVTGHVSVAATPEFGRRVATKFFPAVRERYPSLTLAMHPAYEFEDMQDPGTDIAFRVGSAHDDRLVARKMGAFRCWVVAAPEVAHEHGVERPNDLALVPCLPFRGNSASAQWTLFGADGTIAIDVSGVYAVRSLTILYELALEGRGFALLPDFMVEPAIDTGALVRVLPDYMSKPFPVFLTFRPGARRIARIDATLKVAEDVVPSLLSEPPDA